ncbi:MAG: hypothetical protein HYV97_08655 [Bdellovibrio sp.]|nr:hypothetical protein [Bdellovibrio sp.]
MRAYFRDRLVGLCSFLGDLGLGALVFAFFIGQSSHFMGRFLGQLFTEVLALMETLGMEFGVRPLSVHLFLIYTLTLFLRTIFIMLLGRSPGDMAIGRVAFISLSERGKDAGKNLLMIFAPPLCLMHDPRRRNVISWSMIILLVVTAALWPWPMLWYLTDNKKFSKNESFPITELRLDAGKGNYDQYVLFESQVFGLEALSENPQTLLTFPCPQNAKLTAGAEVCFYDVATREWLILSMPGRFSMEAPLARYLEFSRPFSAYAANNLTDLVIEAMELGRYDGIKGVLKHGPFLQGLLHFKLFLLQLTVPDEVPGASSASLIKIGGRNFFSLKSENGHDWSFSLFPLETYPAPLLNLSGPARSVALRERFAATFLSSIKWSETGNSEGEGLGGLCDFVFAPGNKVDSHRENALAKLYASIAKVAIRDKSVALRRLLLRSLQQFKRSKRSNVSERLEKMMGAIFIALSNSDSKTIDAEAGESPWK